MNKVKEEKKDKNEVIQQSSCTHLQGSGDTAENVRPCASCDLRELSAGRWHAGHIPGPLQAGRMSGHEQHCGGCPSQRGQFMQDLEGYEFRGVWGPTRNVIPRPQEHKTGFRVGV